MLRRHWIPPLGLLTAHLAHGMSWAFLFVLAAEVDAGVTLDSLAWVHLVALGWLTLIGLSVLLHVIPAFTDKQWYGEGWARSALVVYAIGAGGLIASFATHAFALLTVFGAVIAAGLLGYLIPAFATLFVPPPPERTERAIARALGTTLVFLAIAVGLGVTLTILIRTSPFVALAVALVHADIALLGWLSLLIIGVSVRTLRVIGGSDARMPRLHVVIGIAMLLGVLVTAAGFALGRPSVVDAGAVALVIAAAAYLLQLGVLLVGGDNPHRPPRAFAIASGAWLAVCVGLGIGILFGGPYGAALVFVLLVGWLGQMVNAHMHHIGIRLLSTMARGNDDETRPIELLDGRLSWLTFGAFQIAVLTGLWAIIARDSTPAWISATCGVIGWIAMTGNVIVAWGRAQQPASTISLL
jgi:hypothetical protein